MRLSTRLSQSRSFPNCNPRLSSTSTGIITILSSESRIIRWNPVSTPSGSTQWPATTRSTVLSPSFFPAPASSSPLRPVIYRWKEDSSFYSISRINYLPALESMSRSSSMEKEPLSNASTALLSKSSTNPLSSLTMKWKKNFPRWLYKATNNDSKLLKTPKHSKTNWFLSETT